MIDPPAISAALTSLRAIVDLVKNANDAQLAVRIAGETAELQSQLLNVGQQALEVQAENDRLRAENQKFRTYSFHHSVSWRMLPDASEDGPFCPICLAEGKDMPLLPNPHVDQTKETWFLYCPKSHVESKGTVRDLTRGREPFYLVPKEIVSKNRFASG